MEIEVKHPIRSRLKAPIDVATSLSLTWNQLCELGPKMELPNGLLIMIPNYLLQDFLDGLFHVFLIQLATSSFPF